MSQKKKVWIILFSCIILLALYGIYDGNKRDNGIKKNKEVTIGEIVEIDKGFVMKGRGEEWLYEFIVQGKLYKGVHGSNWPKNSSVFLHKNFPVVYNSSNPERNAMLIFPKDFEIYEEVFPDSLQWVLKYKP